MKFSYGAILIVLHEKRWCTLRKGEILKNSVKDAVLRKSFELGTIFIVQPNNCSEQTLVIELWNVMGFSDVHLGQQSRSHICDGDLQRKRVSWYECVNVTAGWNEMCWNLMKSAM